MSAKHWTRLLVAVALAFAGAALAVRSEGSTLAQTQLRGLTGVNVAVHVSGELEDREGIETFVRQKVEEYLRRSGIALVATNSETMRVEINGARSSCVGGEPLVAIHVAAKLIEHVSLRRDPSSDVPGGGAITWWRDGTKMCAEKGARQTIETAIDYFLGAFTDEWKAENPAAAKVRRGSSLN